MQAFFHLLCPTTVSVLRVQKPSLSSLLTVNSEFLQKAFLVQSFMFVLSFT